MGSACCIAAREKDLPSRTGGNALYRNVRCSPTWSFQWENRRRVASEIDDSPYQTSHRFSRDVSVEVKGPVGSDRGNLSDEVSLHESFGTPVSLKSPVHEGVVANLIAQPSGVSMEHNYPVHGKNSSESPDIAELPAPKLSFSVDSSFSTSGVDPLPACDHSFPPSSTPSRRAQCSPGHRLLRQISDSRIMGLKSPNDYSLSEGRSSFVFSTCSHDFATGSYGGSSDGWSMRTFSELVASSQRERWSFDSEHLGYGLSKLSGCSGSQRILASNELSVVAVLVCGHVYHSECLEAMTLEVDRYDPSCPICMGGEKQVPTMSKKALRAEAELKARSRKISRNRVIDGYLDSDSDDFDYQKNAMWGGAPKMEPSSSAASSSTKPFLRRHFSFGSKWTRSLSDKDSARKKGFWARYRKY
ncbi:hypothetical protein MANES_18G021006v8 [Manihot esculenta]|uniref:Uncharacterized protein n=3 Tax=Manihot esculenta TaxID=3983 RepID=A0ACB7FY24_MANES|nr:hypothetical protein MANES_18G021006v8 [Manihot esculenta]OAY22728.1 hypothetical protein MANES_18G021006v8 [Manihot esculenta]